MRFSRTSGVCPIASRMLLHFIPCLGLFWLAVSPRRCLQFSIIAKPADTSAASVEMMPIGLFLRAREHSTADGRESSPVGVGIMIAHNPLHGSGQAGFPHPALALGDNAHAAQGIGMTDGRQRQPASDEAPAANPEDACVPAN